MCDTDRISNMDKILTQSWFSQLCRYNPHTHDCGHRTAPTHTQRARFTDRPAASSTRVAVYRVSLVGVGVRTYVVFTRGVTCDRVPRATACTGNEPGSRLPRHVFRSTTHSLDSPPPRCPPRSRRGTPPRLFAPTPSRPISALIATRRSSSRSPLARFSHGVTVHPAARLLRAWLLHRL